MVLRYMADIFYDAKYATDEATRDSAREHIIQEFIAQARARIVPYGYSQDVITAKISKCQKVILEGFKLNYYDDFYNWVVLSITTIMRSDEVPECKNSKEIVEKQPIFKSMITKDDIDFNPNLDAKEKTTIQKYIDNQAIEEIARITAATQMGVYIRIARAFDEIGRKKLSKRLSENQSHVYN